ncbi:DUF5133 domain-containing protein [Streptomyces enissocaesilis]|uniref:DUF5133 domain-containing protein n=1 Tax=Streptomyces enissocaesilis TaxID=332589 RepID=UPI0031D1FCA9
MREHVRHSRASVGGTVVVLKPEPRCVRTLLARYASARIALAEKPDQAWQRELADVTYTLCVVTGTRSITDAIAAADEILEAARQPEGESRAPLAPETTLAA